MPPTTSTENPLLRDTSTLIASIPRPTVTLTPGKPILQESLTTLTSYDLLPGEQGTIIVPGCPPVWSPLPLPATVPADRGTYTTDPVGFIFPHCPLEPFFRALAITKPKFDLSTIDVISDRRNLRLLRSFVDAKAKGSDAKPFRIGVEVVGKTVLFFCWHTEEKYEVKRFMGYGRGFEKAFTKPSKEARGSVSHNRAVTYTLGGLRLVVRFKVEGYIPTRPVGSDSGEKYKGLPYKTMKALNPKLTPTGYKIQIKGSFIPSSQLLEIKTGVMGKDLEERSSDQMWFSRTRTLCAGHWDRGRGFTSVKEIDMLHGGQLDKWAVEKEQSLRGLVRVLEIVGEVVRRKGGRYALVREEASDVLKILEVSVGCPGGVPDDVKEGWGKVQC